MIILIIIYVTNLQLITKSYHYSALGHSKFTTQSQHEYNTPRGARCPFKLIPSTQEDSDEKEKIIVFKQPIDPADPNGIKLTHNARVLCSTFIEDVL